MRKFSKVEQVFVGTTAASSPSLTKKPSPPISNKLALLMSGLIQVSNMAKRSVSLSKINFIMAGYLLFIDLIFA